MIRYLVDEEGHFWKAAVVDDIVVVEHGKIGEEPTVDVVHTWEKFSTPPEYSLDKLAEDFFEYGYSYAPIPDVVKVIEEAHDATLPGPVRAFFQDETYWDYMGHTCAGLRCEVDFLDDSVLGNYMQEHYDRDRGEHRTFVPISAVVYDGAPDEQRWIGVDPKETDNPKVYALYTSGEFEVAYESFGEFIDDLTPASQSK